MGRECARCGHDNRAGRRFCGGCGAGLPADCPACGFANEAADRFCGGCGAGLGSARPTRGELRHVVVLFADLEDYTGLSGRLEAEEVHRMLGKLFHEVDGAVTECGGTIDKHIGDNVMALFGAPVAHGNDAMRAVRAAATIHERVAALGESLSLPLRVHIGIAAGQVMASGLGSSHHHEYTVIGGSVNLAARLQGTAGGGETLVDETVYRAVAHAVDAAPAGELSLKGIDAPVQAWTITAMRDAPAPPQRPMIGREAERARLQKALAAVRDRDRGGVIVLRGEAGIGKSRLAREAADIAARLGYACHDFGFVDFGPGDGGVGRFLRSGVDRDWLTGLAHEHPLRHAHLCALMGEEVPHAVAAQYEALDNESRNAGRRDAIVAAAERAASAGPCLLTVEDAHWAGDTGLRLIGALAAAAHSARSVLLVTTRPEPDAAVDVAGAEVIELAPLPRGDSATLAAALGGDDTVVQLAVERAGGNPLFLEELVSSAREGSRSAVPGNVHALVLARIDRLDAGDREAVQVASVLGLRFELDTLRAALEAPAYDPVEPVRRGLLSTDDAELSFRHALIRDGVYESITREDRRALHTRISELPGIDLTVRARHLDRAEDARASLAYVEAANALASRFDYDTALQLLDRASELSGDGDVFAVQSTRGRVLREVGRPRDASAAFAVAGEAAPTDRDRCRATIDEASAHRAMSAFAPALGALARAGALASRPAEQMQIHYHRASILFAQSKLAESEREARAALEIASTLGDPEWEARARSAVGDVSWGLGDIRTAQDCFVQCVAIADAVGLTRFGIPNRIMLGHSMLWLGNAAGASRATERAIATAAGIHDRYGQMFGLHSLGLVRRYTGDIEGAVDVVTRALELARQLQASRFESEILVQSAELEIDRGGDGLALAREAVDLARTRDVMSYVGPWALALLARVTPDADECQALLAEGAAMIADGTLCYSKIIFHAHAWHATSRHGDTAARDEHERAFRTLVERHEAAVLADFVPAPVGLTDR